MTMPAGNVALPPVVSLFHQILIWPLLIKDWSPPSNHRDPLNAWTDILEKAAGTQWKRIDAKRESDYRSDHYEEVVYFHPFVRDFLYGDATPDPKRRPIRLFERTDVIGVRLTFWDRELRGPKDLDLAVERVTLFLFESHVALFVVEVWNGERDLTHEGPGVAGKREVLTLAQVLEVQDRFRRAYPPFWFQDEEGRTAAGHCPMEVVWKLRDGGTVESTERVTDEPCFRKFVRDRP